MKFPTTKYFQNIFTRFMFEMVNHPAFNLFIFIIIGLNTITLCLDIYSVGEGTVEIPALVYFNYLFFAIFTIEVIAKMIGLGLKQFVLDKFNVFDTFVVVISFVEILLSSGSGTFSSLRAFRLFRIFKVFRVGELRVLID